MIFDSNVLIYFVDPAYHRLRIYLGNSLVPLCVSLITHLEVLGYHRLSANDRIELIRLLAKTSTIPITTVVIEKAIELRQQRKRRWPIRSLPLRAYSTKCLY